MNRALDTWKTTSNILGCVQWEFQKKVQENYKKK